MARAEIEAVAAELGLSINSVFVPWSQSRNKGEKYRSLNWRVTLLCGTRELFTIDYSAGCGHCAAYKASIKELGGRDCIMRDAAIRDECETGRAYAGAFKQGEKHKPDLCDVLYSLAMDSRAIDCATFEDWANEYGYEPDSRKGEKVYRECLEIALKLRAGIGEAGLKKLSDATQDY